MYVGESKTRPHLIVKEGLKNFCNIENKILFAYHRYRQIHLPKKIISKK